MIIIVFNEEIIFIEKIIVGIKNIVGNLLLSFDIVMLIYLDLSYNLYACIDTKTNGYNK